MLDVRNQRSSAVDVNSLVVISAALGSSFGMEMVFRCKTLVFDITSATEMEVLS